MNKRPLVMIEWNDASACANWLEADDLADDVRACPITSVGFLLAEKNGHKVIAAHVSGSGRVTGDMTIPEGCITKVRRLPDPRRRRKKK